MKLWFMVPKREICPESIHWVCAADLRVPYLIALCFVANCRYHPSVLLRHLNNKFSEHVLEQNEEPCYAKSQLNTCKVSQVHDYFVR